MTSKDLVRNWIFVFFFRKINHECDKHLCFESQYFPHEDFIFLVCIGYIHFHFEILSAMSEMYVFIGSIIIIYAMDTLQ